MQGLPTTLRRYPRPDEEDQIKRPALPTDCDPGRRAQAAGRDRTAPPRHRRRGRGGGRHNRGRLCCPVSRGGGRSCGFFVVKPDESAPLVLKCAPLEGKDVGFASVASVLRNRELMTSRAVSLVWRTPQTLKRKP